MTRKWIARRMAELDPETDYDEIWKLGTAYRPNEFMMNLIYAVTFPHFLVRDHDAAPVVNSGAGKIFTDPDKRSEDTSRKMQVWWYHGSASEQARRNVESINKLHEHYFSQFPGSFGSNDSYLYTLCYEHAGMHRLLRRVGLPGITENEKRAGVHFWSRMAQLFRNVSTGHEIEGYPDSFEGVMAYMDRFEGEVIEPQPLGVAGARAILDQFAQRWFPRPLHGFARAWVVSLYPDHLIYSYQLERPHSLVVRLFRLGTAAFFTVGEKVLPDPPDTYTERRQARKAAERAQGRAAASRPDPTTGTTSGAALALAAAATSVGTCPHPH